MSYESEGGKEGVRSGFRQGCEQRERKEAGNHTWFLACVAGTAPALGQREVAISWRLPWPVCPIVKPLEEDMVPLVAKT